MDKDYYISLIYKSLDGQISASEKGELKKWLSLSTDNQLIEKNIKKVWELGGNFQSEVDLDMDTEFDLLKKKMGSEPKVVQMKPQRRWLSIAASFLVLIAAGFLFNQYFNQTTAENWILVEASEQKEIQLSDDSKVWLNKGAILEYTAEFGEKRLVKLTGEGFFEVTKNKEKPFVVETQNLEVTVLGTSFNVRDEVDEISVLVRTGKVNMRPKNKKEGIDLTKNQKGIFDKKAKELNRISESKANDDSWNSGRLVFDNQTFLEISKGLEKHYEQTISIENEAMKTCKHTISFTNKSFEEVVETLKIVFEFEIEKTENRVVLKNGVCP